MQASQHNNQEKLKTHEFNMGVLEAIGASVLILCIVSIICCRFQRVCCMTKNSVHPSVSSIMKMAVQDRYLIGQNEIQQVQDVRATDNMFKVCTGVLHQSVVVALKTMSVDGHPEVTPILETTLRSLSRLRHPNLALFLGILVDPDPKVSRLTLIHEWAPGPSLEIFLQDVPLSASCNSILALGIGQAMHYLHSQRPPALQHDLLPANIIVSSPKAFTAHQEAFEKLNIKIVGISKDSVKSHDKFVEKQALGMPLLSDEEGDICEQFGVWKEKSMYGKTYFGIERSTFLIDGSGQVVQEWRKVKVAGHVEAVLAAAQTL